jgi:hypothetical protein
MEICLSYRRDIRNVAKMLDRKLEAPGFIAQAIGEHCGKFYLINRIHSTVSRLTPGAYTHLRRSWSGQHLARDA